MNARQAIASLLLAVVLPCVSFAAAPRTMAFQGVLTDATGKPRPAGNYNLTFRLFDSLTGPNVVWTEANKQVTVLGAGGFSAVLGDPTPFALAFDQPYFLSIQVAGEAAPMAPRVALQSVPYALNSGGASLSLPFSGTTSVSTPGSAVSVTNSGTGSAISGNGAGGPGIYGTATANNAITGVTSTVYAAIYGKATGSGTGIYGEGTSNAGVYGVSNTSTGVYGHSNTWFGVFGDSVASVGIQGQSVNYAGVAGVSTNWIGTYGESTGFDGIQGKSHAVGHAGVAGINDTAGYGVYGSSASYYGVYGHGVASIGVYGDSDQNFGVQGNSTNFAGVVGTSGNWIGVYGHSGTSLGVQGESDSSEGVRGVSHNVNHGGVTAFNTAGGDALYAHSDGGGYAGYFDGRVRVAVLEIAGGADLAEKFETSERAEPGTVMAIDVDHPGRLCVSHEAYSTAVAGVVSGAKTLNAGIVLPDAGSGKDGLPVAMSGRVWVKCDAANGAIKPGDLLTTSDTPGHAMKATDRSRAPGASIGKAMTALAAGKGFVLALVSLQ